jgi:ubiquinone/menaquinone biosynthesis C-methylase UbiE
MTGMSGHPIHPAAAVGFERGAEAYERGRPSYPTRAVAALVRDAAIDRRATVVDLAAGTGKLTRLLAAVGVERLVAVEPVEAMRRRCRTEVPSAAVLAGTAQAIPLRSGCAHAVTVAQAFHWFAEHEALAEVHRVLRPGGHLALVWNTRDDTLGWVAAIDAITDRHLGNAPNQRSGAWRRVFDHADQPWFGPLAHREFTSTQWLSPEGLVDRIASVSVIAALPDAEHRAVRAELAELIATHPDTQGRAEIALPHRTDLYVARRLPL